MNNEQIHDAAFDYVLKTHSQADNDFQNAMNIAAAKAFVNGAQWSKEKIIEEMIEWLRDQEELIGVSFQDDFIERFKTLNY